MKWGVRKIRDNYIARRRRRISRNPSKLRKHQYEYSQKEIDDALRRFDSDKRLREYRLNSLKRGRDYVATMAGLSVSALLLHKNSKEIKTIVKKALNL